MYCKNLIRKFELLLVAMLLAATPGSAAVEGCSDLGEPTYFQAGRNDVFAEPTDPSMRRPELDAFFASQNPVWTDFDDPNSDRWVGHTFTGLPSSICKVDLIIVARNLGGLSSNDSLLLGSATSAEGFATLAISSLTDVGDSETHQAYVLDLGAIVLSSGKSILELIEEEGLLDMLIQDDTMVDFYELRVYSSPWRTRYCGRPDGYASPNDPVQRSSQLNAAYPQAMWKQADDPTVNRFFGCSFSGLPETLFDAQIEVQMKPGNSGLSDNDSLNFGLRAGPSFGFSSRIEDLAEAGGSWDAGVNGPTLIQRDVTDLIENSRLDVLIQDDTTVDYVRLRYRTCPPPIPCFGLTCLAINDTPIEAVGTQIQFPLPGALEIDISGGDGACVNLSCPDGGRELVELLATGTFEQSDGTFSCRLNWQDDGNVATVSADFPDGLDVFMAVEVLVDDQLVTKHVAPTEGPAATIPSGTCLTELDLIPFGSDPKTHCLQLLLQDNTPVDILQGGPSGVVGNKVRICPPLIPGMPKFVPSGVTVSGTGADPLVIESSTIFIGEQAYISIGGASFEPANGALRVVDLPSAGGGFSVALGNAQAAEMALSLEESAEEPIGGTLDINAFGTFDGQTDAPLGRLEMVRTEDGIQLGTDFTAIDSATQTVQIWRQGEMVAERVLPAGAAALASQWPDRFGKLDFETECYVARFPSDTTLVLFGESPLDSKIELVGDELRLLAQDSTGDRIDFKTRLSVIAGGGMEGMTVLETRVGTGCEETPRRLCLNQGRFAVEADWRAPNGGFGQGRAVRLTADTGYFWFFDEDNVELIVKSLDGCGLNERLWVFGGGLTDVEVLLKVTDTWTGGVELYLNPLGTAFQPLQDTNAFVGCDALPVAFDLMSSGPAPPGEDRILLNGGRFEVRAEWSSGQATGEGRGVQLTEDTGYFWFFNADNVEMVVKVLDACTFADRFWVFAGGLTDVEVELIVKDNQTGEEVRYTNPSQTPFQPIQDTSAFNTCP